MAVKWTRPNGLYSKLTLICSLVQGMKTKLSSEYDNKTFEGQCFSQIFSLSGYTVEIYMQATNTFNSFEQQISKVSRYYVGNEHESCLLFTCVERINECVMSF